MASPEASTYRPETLAVGHGGAEKPLRAMSMPIFQTAQFELPGPYVYTRCGNPTTEAFEQHVARLEGAAHACAYASGLAAIAALTKHLSRHGPIHIMRGCFAGTSRLFQAEQSGELEWHTIPRDPEQWPDLVRAPATIWLESPTNPLLQTVSLTRLRQLFPAASGVRLVVDNTFATPALQRPLSHGIDFVVHSVSKFLAGHSDVIAGLVLTNDAQAAQALTRLRGTYGGSLGPMDAWLAMRGAQTLHLRMRQASNTAHQIATLLSEHRDIAVVYYPGLQHPELIGTQMTHGGAVVSFELNANRCPQRFMEAFRLIKVAESLGGVESLINQCATMSHLDLPAEEKARINLNQRVFRLSVGIEHPQDLIDDLTAALNAVVPTESLP
jgi:cystathionine beta-lyase/cystathionine gamma-synthase